MLVNAVQMGLLFDLGGEKILSQAALQNSLGNSQKLFLIWMPYFYTLSLNCAPI